jgi:hypothetical protein
MLLCLDLTDATNQLLAGTLLCASPACAGVLRPWGHARFRSLRDGDGYRPRRARCHTCRRTHVLGWAHSYPRRADHVNVVAAALLGAAAGLGHRAAAALVNRPSSTVRDWIRRARVNSEPVRVLATRRALALDSVAERFDPTGTPLGDMLDAVGRAVMASTLRLGPSGAGPWQHALVITRAGILAPSRRSAT